MPYGPRCSIANVGTTTFSGCSASLRHCCPRYRDNSCCFGVTATSWFGTSIPITGMAGNQHAGMVVQPCFEPGIVKSPCGPGCFALHNTGGQQVHAQSRTLPTMAFRTDGIPTYAAEPIVAADPAIKWLRDGLGPIDHALQTGDKPARVEVDPGVDMVPAFVGLEAGGAPSGPQHGCYRFDLFLRDYRPEERNAPLTRWAARPLSTVAPLTEFGRFPDPFKKFQTLSLETSLAASLFAAATMTPHPRSRRILRAIALIFGPPIRCSQSRCVRP